MTGREWWALEEGVRCDERGVLSGEIVKGGAIGSFDASDSDRFKGTGACAIWSIWWGEVGYRAEGMAWCSMFQSDVRYGKAVRVGEFGAWLRRNRDNGGGGERP